MASSSSGMSGCSIQVRHTLVKHEEAALESPENRLAARAKLQSQFSMENLPPGWGEYSILFCDVCGSF